MLLCHCSLWVLVAFVAADWVYPPFLPARVVDRNVINGVSLALLRCISSLLPPVANFSLGILELLCSVDGSFPSWYLFPNILDF